MKKHTPIKTGSLLAAAALGFFPGAGAVSANVSNSR
jgi:hypothetical protein